MPVGDSHDVIHTIEGSVSWIVLNRPERRNAITAEQREIVIALLEEASSSPDIRCVVIAAQGKDFCTGADLKAAKQARAVEGAERLPGDTAFIARQGPQRLITAVLDCDVPVVAAVNGTAAGLGMHLALACDLVVAADDARFIEVFVRRGLVPDGGGIWLLPRLVGMQRAKELMLLGDDLSADRAREFGLVNSVVPAADLEQTVRALATRLAQGPSVMLGLTKRLLNRSLESDRVVALDDEAEAVEQARATADAQEGIDSFIERRPARFQGR